MCEKEMCLYLCVFSEDGEGVREGAGMGEGREVESCKFGD